MPAVVLRGSFPLTTQSILSAVPENCFGVYAFGEWTPLGGMWVKRIGRAHRPMRDELHACVGHYALFQFLCCSSIADVFICECELYHRYLPRENTSHPLAPEGITIQCPICGFQDE